MEGEAECFSVIELPLLEAFFLSGAHAKIS